MSYFEDVNIKYASSPAIDAFARLRVSTPNTVFDSKQLFDNAPLFWDDAQTSGSGTSSSHSTTNAATTISVGASTAGTRVRQTFRRFNYQPGKSQLALMTGVLGSGATGITRRIGIFDGNDGLFFELAGTTLKVVERKATSDTAVSQSSWNYDKLDGSGRSGINIDTSKTQIFFIDFEWLGVGAVRYGIVVNGMPILCHISDHSNSSTSVYMSTPNLPLRYEISNSGTGGAASLVHICTSLNSEGGTELNGLILSDSNGVTPVTCSSSGTYYALIGMRLKSTYFGATIQTLYLSFLGTTTNDMFHWQMRVSPTVASTFTYTGITNSAIETAKGVTANTVTGGTIVASGYGMSQSNLSAILESTLTLGASIAGIPTTFVLCATPHGSTIDLLASVTWRELL